MAKARNIRNLASLDREIYRLQLQARKLEDKLGNNLEYFQENSSSLFMNSFFGNRHGEKGKKNGHSFAFWKNEMINFFFEKFSENIAGKLADGVNKMFDRIFHKEK